MLLRLQINCSNLRWWPPEHVSCRKHQGLFLLSFLILFLLFLLFPLLLPRFSILFIFLVLPFLSFSSLNQKEIISLKSPFSHCPFHIIGHNWQTSALNHWPNRLWSMTYLLWLQNINLLLWYCLPLGIWTFVLLSLSVRLYPAPSAMPCTTEDRWNWIPCR